LIYIRLTSIELEVPVDEPQKDERCRSIERGAKIVTVMPTKYSVVLQMPRGNLETIYPRAMVLAAIRRSIEAESYDEAFFTCRNQRVDMNILHDHDPERFLTNIPKVIAQIQKAEHIDLLLSQLRSVGFSSCNPEESSFNISRNEDVSQTMYRESSKAKDLVLKTGLAPSLAESKVNRVCDAFLSTLQQEQYKKIHWQNLITAHVCKVPADLESGLEMIGRLHGNKTTNHKTASKLTYYSDP
jgi:elongator complex protein 1